MMQTLITAFLAFFGVVIGAFLQHWFSRTSAKENNLREERQKAYSNLLQGVALQARSPGKEALTILTDAKLKIAIYGSDIVIGRLAAYESAGAKLDSQNSIHAFLSLVQSMRSDSFKEKPGIDTEDLKIILFGTREPH
jgi:hypothetical protein